MYCPNDDVKRHENDVKRQKINVNSTSAYIHLLPMEQNRVILHYVKNHSLELRGANCRRVLTSSFVHVSLTLDGVSSCLRDNKRKKYMKTSVLQSRIFVYLRDWRNVNGRKLEEYVGYNCFFIVYLC